MNRRSLGPSFPPTHNLKYCDTYQELVGSKAIPSKPFIYIVLRVRPYSAPRESVWDLAIEQLVSPHRGVRTIHSTVFSHMIPEVCDQRGKFKISVWIEREPEAWEVRTEREVSWDISWNTAELKSQVQKGHKSYLAIISTIAMWRHGWIYMTN